MRGVVRVVTGGGKTVFAELCISAFMERHPNGRVIIVVPTTALLDQWVVSLTEDVHIPGESIGCFSGEEKANGPKPVNILVINTARTLGEKLSGDVPAMLVVDECHRAGSPENARALRGNYVAGLGLSATPEREYDTGFEDAIAPALGPVIYDYDYLTAARDRVISPFALHNVRVQMLPDEQLVYDRLSRRIAVEKARLKKSFDSDEKVKRLLQQRAAVAATATMRIPVAVKLLEAHVGRRAIIFHERIEAADKIVQILRARGRSATVYHAGVAPALRRDNLRLYRKGVYDILVCCRALDEGLNVPETEVAVIASSTASLRQRIQRLGRVLRPAANKDRAVIYTIYASDVEESRLAAEAESLADVSDIAWSRVRD